MINKYRWFEMVGIYCGITLFLTFILAPFLEAFLVSLRPWREIVSIPYAIITEGMSFDAYFSVWHSIPLLWVYIWNSFFIGISATIITLIAVIPAAWAFARFRFWGRDALLWSLLAINMVGATTLITPLFLMLMNLGLLNTYWALIVPGTAFLIPIGIWLLRSYFMKIPRELEEAAWPMAHLGYTSCDASSFQLQCPASSWSPSPRSSAHTHNNSCWPSLSMQIDIYIRCLLGCLFIMEAE